jgi:uncharacterized BrkB/YihY/UPF0761 family membrane protein
MDQSSPSASMFRNQWIVALFVVSILVNIALWIIFFTSIPTQTEQIVLHYTCSFGPDLFGEYVLVYRVPLAGVLFLAIHVVLAWLFYKKERLASYVLASSSVIIQLFLLVAAISIVYVNNVIGNLSV